MSDRKVSQRSLWTQRSLAFLRKNWQGQNNSSYTTLRRQLYGRDYRDRLLALTEIFPLGAVGVPLLLEACGDPHSGVRELALKCLSAFSDRAEVAQLLETVAQWRGIRCINTSQAHDTAITGLTISPDQQIVVRTAADAEETKLNHPVNLIEKNISAIAINQSQSKLAIATTDGKLQILCQKTRRKLWGNRLDDRCAILSLAFDAEEQVLWSGDRRSRLSSWHAETGALMDTWSSWSDRGIQQLITIPASPVLLHNCGMGVKIWHRQLGFLIHELVGHRAAVGAIAVSDDGQQVVTGSDDGVIKIWQC